MVKVMAPICVRDIHMLRIHITLAQKLYKNETTYVTVIIMLGDQGHSQPFLDGQATELFFMSACNSVQLATYIKCIYSTFGGH